MTIDEKIELMQKCSKKLKRIETYIHNVLDTGGDISLNGCNVDVNDFGRGYVTFGVDYNGVDMGFEIWLGSGDDNGVLTEIKMLNVDAQNFNVSEAVSDTSNVELDFAGVNERHILSKAFMIIGRILQIWGEN